MTFLNKESEVGKNLLSFLIVKSKLISLNFLMNNKDFHMTMIYIGKDNL